jgi:predicted acyl esterase
VTSEPVLCSLDALSNTAVVDPAQELTAQTPAGLPAGQLVVVAGKPATLTPTSGADDTNGPATDPIIGPTAFPHPDCRVATSPTAGSTGYTVYSTALNQQETLVGIGWTEARYSSLTQGTSALLAERLWDVAPDGTASLVTHGIYRFDFNGYDPPSGTVRVPFFGTHWILAPGHRLRLDLEQVDSPTFRPPNPDATATLTLSGIRTVYGTRQATTVTVPAS